MADRSVYIAITHLILMGLNVTLAIIGWIVLKEYKSEYLFIGILLPSIGLTGAGLSTFAYRNKPQSFTLAGIIASSMLSVIGEIYVIVALFFALGFYKYHQNGQTLAVALITILLSFQILIFSLYNIIRCYRQMKTLCTSENLSHNQSNPVDDNDETVSLYREPLCHSTTSFTSSFNTILHNNRIMGIVQMITGTLSVIIGLVSLFVVTDAFTLANTYLGTIVITSGIITLLSHKFPELTSLNIWSFILSRSSSIWSLSTTLSSLLYYLSTVLRKEAHLRYTVLFIITLWGAVANFGISICITALRIKRQRSPFFTFIIFNRFGSTISTSQLIFRTCLAFLGLLILIVGIIEPFIGVSSHLFITFTVGCQLIVSGHFGNNLVLKNSENETMAYFFLSTVSLSLVIGYIAVTIAEFATLINVSPQVVTTGVVAMFCVNEIILFPSLIISIYEVITCGKQIGLCWRDNFAIKYKVAKEPRCNRNCIVQDPVNLEMVEAKV